MTAVRRTGFELNLQDRCHPAGRIEERKAFENDFQFACFWWVFLSSH